MSEEGKADTTGHAPDGSRRFTLVGGKHDAHRKNTKKGAFKLRIYPDERAQGYYVGKSFVTTRAAVFPATIEYAGELYKLPDVGNEARFVRKVDVA